MKISLIAAMAKNRVIGANNQMLWHLPADFAWFREHTLGKPVVMGRKTFESIGKALPNRKNIVLSRQPDFAAEHQELTVVDSLSAAIHAAGDVPEVMIIGGDSIYQQALADATHLYLTFVDATLEGDAFFPEYEFDQNKNRINWQEIASKTHPIDDKNAYAMQFFILQKD